MVVHGVALSHEPTGAETPEEEGAPSHRLTAPSATPMETQLVLVRQDR